jgi:hypothetical protein
MLSAKQYAIDNPCKPLPAMLGSIQLIRRIVMGRQFIGRHTHTIGIPVEIEIYDEIIRVASRRRQTLAEFGRAALMQYLDLVGGLDHLKAVDAGKIILAAEDNEPPIEPSVSSVVEEIHKADPDRVSSSIMDLVNGPPKK